jgi:hypothetical protein
VGDFAAATLVDDRGDGTFGAELDPQWSVGGRPNGGYLLAVLARAAVAPSAFAHPRSASAIYLTPPEVGPAVVVVESLRVGRTAEQVRARLVQDEKTHVEALFTLGHLDASAEPSWVDGPPVAVAPFDECPRSPEEPPGSGMHIAMLGAFDQRLDVTAIGNPPGEFRGWVDFLGGEPIDPVALLFVADAFPPATFTLGSAGWVPTLELTVYVRAVPAPGPLRVRQRARAISGNLVDQVCEIWDGKDRVVAQATQLASFRTATR